MSSTFADKSGRGILLAALNEAAAAQGYTFISSDLDFGPVEESTNPARENQFAYTATPDSRYEGSQVAYYNRLDLEGIFTAGGVDVVQIHQGPATLQAVVAQVNARYGLGFTADDIVVEGEVASDASEVILEARESSYGFKGSVVVQLVEGKIPLAEVVLDPVLAGPVYPVDVPGYLEEPVIIEGTISEKGQKEDGSMLNGTANPSSDFTMVNNGEIELGLAARIYRGADTVAPVEGHYDLTVPEDGDWNWPIHVALLQEERPITDLYDVTLTVTSVETGQSLPFQMIRTDDGVLHYINETNQLDIEDNVTSESGDVTQNIQRVTFYKDYLGEMAENNAGAPVGNFIVELTAVRREGLVPVLNCTITVSANRETVDA